MLDFNINMDADPAEQQYVASVRLNPKQTPLYTSWQTTKEQALISCVLWIIRLSNDVVAAGDQPSWNQQ
jgi:hypothetical protein